jgi:aspartate aminotransferase-like enzyme
MGMKLVAERPAEVLTACYVPEGVDASVLLGRLHERFGVKLAGGQGRLKGRILRIGHMGQIDELDILGVLASLELVLVEMGHLVTLGSGVAAASRVLAGEAIGSNQ